MQKRNRAARAKTAKRSSPRAGWQVDPSTARSSAVQLYPRFYFIFEQVYPRLFSSFHRATKNKSRETCETWKQFWKILFARITGSFF
jgi:hypothetical protein